MQTKVDDTIMHHCPIIAYYAVFEATMKRYAFHWISRKHLLQFENSAKIMVIITLLLIVSTPRGKNILEEKKISSKLSWQE